jgi:hypothetical protein
MKYYLFAGSTYYAAGGANDFIKSSDDLEHLLEYARELLQGLEDTKWNQYDWYHIADENMQIIDKSDEQAHC